MAGARSGKAQKELLALVHQHLVQAGFARAAQDLLEESRQKTFPPSPVPLREIFAQWKKLQPQKRKADDGKRETPTKIRVPDPKSSSESSEEEEETNTTKSNVPANNSSMVNAESSSEDEDLSSDEEAVARKVVKTPVTENKPTDLLQLAAQKTTSFPGKGVAVASVQAKGRQNKASLSKPLSPAVAKAGQNKVPSGKQGPASQSPVAQGQHTAQGATPKTAVASESSSGSSSSESEEEKTLPVVKSPATPKPALKKAESSSEGSSDDSDSEEEEGGAAKATTSQLKPGVQSAQVKTTLARSLPPSAISSKGGTVKVSPAKTPANRIRIETGNTAKNAKPTKSSETSDSSDSEDEEPSSLAQTKSPRKTPQAVTAVVRNTASSKTVTVSSPLKQTPKPSVTKLPTSSKEVESSDSSESSSESGDETLPVPVSQKRLQTPQHPGVAKQSQVDKPGKLMKDTPSILKGKEAESKSSSSSSDSEDETVSAALKPLPPSAATENVPAQPAGALKSQPLSGTLQKAQQSEDSSQDSSDESDSEEDTIFTQKLSQVTQKLVSSPMKAVTAKNAGATPSKAGSAQSAGKGAANPAKSVAASLQKAPASSETESSDSSNSETAARPMKQPPIHPFFKQVTGKAATLSSKSAQVNTGTSESISSKCQTPATVTTGKVEQNSAKKATPIQGQSLTAKSPGLLKGKESSGSSSSSDSEEEEEEGAATASTTVKLTPQPAGIAQKEGAIKEAESSSEESSDEEQEPSQSLLASSSSNFKTTITPMLKSASPMLSKQSSGKAVNLAVSTLTKASGKSAIAGSSSSNDSSDSDTDAEKAVTQTGISSLGKEAVMAKGAATGEKASEKEGSKASAAKKATAKTQSNGKAKGTPDVKLPFTSLPKIHPAEVVAKSSEGATVQVSSTGSQESSGGATPVVAGKTPKATKPSKSGEKKKPSKKRKLAVGEAVLGEPKEKKLKEQSILDLLTKKKKKKKSKASNDTKPPKKKDGKEKKSDKKKKKSKKLESLSEDGSQKKKKKKKKTGDLEGAA